MSRNDFGRRPALGDGLALALAAVAALAAFVALVGYATGEAQLVILTADQKAMAPATAVFCILLAGMIWADVAGNIAALRWTAGSAALASSGLFVVGAVTGHDPIGPAIAAATHIPGTPETSLAMAASCAALATGGLLRPRRQPAAAIAVLCMALSGLVVLGYSYGVRDFYALLPFRSFSLRTALSLLALATGALLANREAEIARLITAVGGVGNSLRRQLSFLVVPPVAAFVLLRASSSREIGPGAAMAILVVLTVVPLAALILRDARAASTVITARRAQTQAAAARAAAEERYKSLFTRLETGFCIVEMAFDETGQATDYRFIEVNPAFAHQTGLSQAEGKWMRELAPRHEQHWFDTYGRVALTGEPVRFEFEAAALGRHFDVHAYQVDAPDQRRVAILFNDVSARRKAELELQGLNETLERRVAERAAELETTQEALRQSQKMEAVGQLTGGLAHDFNNLLTGIAGNLERIQMRIAQGRTADLDRYIMAAQGAAKRAAALTHRLLAFSRRQTLDPKPTDIAALVTGMAGLIRRTVGPQITVESIGLVGLWTARVDPNQLENALLNLAINARDAMPEGGRLTIETGNRWIDERGARERDLPPGQYLSICVSDTGTGMPPDVVARAFDPFFTTKPLGQGTGLGLSMIYGFARQSGGQVRIYSEVAQGTTVCIYLPRHYGEGVDPGQDAAAGGDAPRAIEGETVLVIDDEPTVRMLVVDALSDLGYAAIEAEDGPAGLKVLQSDARIDLLVTDVGLPGGMNGRQVADAGRAVRPGLKVLFITGYAENAVIGDGHLDPGMAVLTKPFAMDDLAGRLRSLIEGSRG